MSTTKKIKQPKLTAHEKKLRAEAKKRLQKDGVLPPDKPRLNRKKFCTDAETILLEHIDFGFCTYLYWGLIEMLNAGAGLNDKGRDPEAVGAAKAIHLALRRQEFEQKHRGEKMTIGQLIEATDDIFKA